MAAACMLFIYLMPSGVWFGLVLFGLVAIWLQWVLLITPPTPSCHLLSVCTVTLTAECHLLRHLSPHINLQALNSTRTNNDLGSKWKSIFSRECILDANWNGNIKETRVAVHRKKSNKTFHWARICKCLQQKTRIFSFSRQKSANIFHKNAILANF